MAYTAPAAAFDLHHTKISKGIYEEIWDLMPMSQ
jgi:hypothetical protein